MTDRLQDDLRKLELIMNHADCIKLLCELSESAVGEDLDKIERCVAGYAQIKGGDCVRHFSPMSYVTYERSS